MGQQVTQILERAFSEIKVELYEMSSGRLAGTVVWKGFEGREQGERQQEVRAALKDALGPDFQQVGVLLTYTPHEMASMRAS